MENKDLLLRDSLQYIIIVLIGFGVVALQESFWEGLLTLVVAAGLTALRIKLKKISYVKSSQ